MATILKILIVDDELNIRKTLALALETEGHKVSAVSNVQDAQTEVRSSKFDLCFLDMRLGTESGLDLLPLLLESSPWLKVIVITAYASIDNAVEAMRRGAFDYIEKPFSVADIYSATQKVATVVDLEEKIRGLEEELGRGKSSIELRSHSLTMQKTLDIARSAAPTDATVLITGENGTGKTELAKAMHGWSQRRNKPFAVVSCPSLSSELLESELFGHTKGAFTGAIKTTNGRIEACEGGTLFLDEIGDMPLPLQSKLLRFLQDREYEPVGGQTTMKADVRVIAATNVKLKEAVRDGRFREDLYYRLNVIPIEVPALRERRDDIPLLAEKCLASVRRDKNVFGFSAECLIRLKAYDWPGNIRELRNIIERAVILCQGQTIEWKDFNLEEAEPGVLKARKNGEFETLDQVEERHIRAVLASVRPMELAAQVLGIDTVTLWRKRKRYGI